MVFDRNKIISFYALGFSLIELSIVLIIISLLVFAIIGGANLIESAKVRSAITEAEDIRTSVYTFYTIRDKLPGDINDDGNIGHCSGVNCSITQEPTIISFPNEYNGISVSYQVEPFVDLYLEKLTTFKPDPTTNLDVDFYGCTETGKAEPYFKSIDGTCIKEFRTFNGHYEDDRYPENKNGVFINVYSIDIEKGIKAKLLKAIDKKIDDGISNYGSFFTDCTNYDQNTCIEAFFKVWSI